jgi:hypothetical protein
VTFWYPSFVGKHTPSISRLDISLPPSPIFIFYSCGAFHLQPCQQPYQAKQLSRKIQPLSGDPFIYRGFLPTNLQLTRASETAIPLRDNNSKQRATFVSTHQCVLLSSCGFSVPRRWSSESSQTTTSSPMRYSHTPRPMRRFCFKTILY